MKNPNSFKAALRATLIIMITCVSTLTHADDSFKKEHPRRAEVNARVRNQKKRIAQGVKSGELSKAQAKTLRGEEAGVKAQERAEVKANGGYLTKPEQKQINQELNKDSQQIHNEKHP